jgi:cyclase
MLRKRVIPCLLLKGQGLVKTIKFKDAKYVGDPLNAVKIFNEKEVDELIILDILATAENRKPQFELLSKIATESFMPLCYGGGIRSVDDIKEVFALGIEKVSINSYAIENPAIIEQAASLYGSQSIVAGIDVKKNRSGKHEVFSHADKKCTKFDPVGYAKKIERLGAGEIFLNSVDRDGTMEGCDISLISEITKAVNIPVIACGGAGQLRDFKDAITLGGASAVAAGSFFVFQGRHHAVLITYPERETLEELFQE